MVSWVGNLERLTWAGLAGGFPGSCWMGLPSSEGSTGLDVQEDALTRLAADTGCWLGAPPGTVNGTIYRCLCSIGGVAFLTWGLTSPPEQASQGARPKLRGL